MNLVRRDLKVRHRGTFLGMLWSLATPLLTVGLYSFIFRFILNSSPAQEARNVPFAIYFFAGLSLWNLLNNSLGSAAGSVIGSGYLLRKVYFPRAILPLTSVLSAAVTFLFEGAVLVVAIVLFVGLPGLQVLWVPMIVVLVALLAYGVGLFLAALTVFFRDVQHFIGIALQLWFWGTPIIYSLSFVAHKPSFVRLLQLNPMTGPVVSFRNVLLLDTQPDWKLLGYTLVVSIVMLLVGGTYYARTQRLFAEIV